MTFRRVSTYRTNITRSVTMLPEMATMTGMVVSWRLSGHRSRRLTVGIRHDEEGEHALLERMELQQADGDDGQNDCRDL